MKAERAPNKRQHTKLTLEKKILKDSNSQLFDHESGALSNWWPASLRTSIFLYACESWTLTAKLQRRIQAMEMKCYRKILRISYKDLVTNDEVRAKIQQAIGSHEDLLTIVKRRNCSGMIMSPVHRSGQNHLARHSERGKKTR